MQPSAHAMTKRRACDRRPKTGVEFVALDVRLGVGQQGTDGVEEERPRRVIAGVTPSGPDVENDVTSTATPTFGEWQHLLNVYS